MSIIDDIKEHINLVDLVEELTPLKHSRGTYTGFCPFHNNTHTPALTVWEDTQTWHCFGCKRGGDVFSLVQERDKCDFRPALETLARVAGVELTGPADMEAVTKTASLKEMLTFAAEHYAANLWADTPQSRRALEERGRRGLSETTLHQLKWGFSLGDDALLRAMTDQRPELIPVARQYGVLRKDGRDFAANSEGNLVSPGGWIIYPHFDRGNINREVIYLSARAVDKIDKGSKSRNLPSVVEIQPYMLLSAPVTGNGDGPKIGQLEDDLFIVEGPADAASVWAMGWPVAALMKQSFNPQFTWLRQYARRKLTHGERVFVGLSNDEPGRIGALGQWRNGRRDPGVAEEISPLARLIFWPMEAGATKSDANSWMIAGGNNAQLAELTASAQTLLDQLIEETAQISHQTRNIKYLAELLAVLGEDDRTDYSNIITGNRNIKVSRGDFQKLLRDTVRAKTDNSYVEITNGLFTEGGFPLASCLLKIDTQQLVHAKTDEDAKIRYHIQGTRPDQRRLKDVEVLADQFDDFKWMAQHWGVDGYVMVGKNKMPMLKNAVINYSLKEIKREEIYSYTGWETINGQRGYLTGSGLLSAGGLNTTIKVELEGHQRLYRLPQTPDDLSIVEAIEASLAFLDIAPDHITAPILLAQYAAPLRPLQSFNALMILYGPSQAKKSNLSHVALCHWGDFLNGLSRRDYHTIIDAASTSIMLQKYNCTLADAVVVVDDVPPGSSNFEIMQQRKKVETLAREMGNRAGRERHGFASLPPNAGICMITAEKLAMQVGSAVGRSFTIEFNRDSVDVKRLSQAQQTDTHLYSQAMAGYVQWLARHWDELSETLPKAVTKFQQDVAQRYTQPRLHDYYATLMASAQALLTFAREMNAIDELAEAEYLKRFSAGLMVDLDNQEDRIAEMQFSRRFFETLSAVLIQKPRALLPMDGYTYTDDNGRLQTVFEPPIGTPMLGWLAPDSGQVYLHDVEALKCVKRHLQDMGEFLDVSVNDLRKELDYLKILGETESYERSKTGREVVQLTVKKKIPGRGWTRVLVINNQAVKNLFDIDLLQSDG